MALCNVSHYSSYFFHKRLCLKTHLEFYLCLEYRKSQDSIALTPAIRKAKKPSETMVVVSKGLRHQPTGSHRIMMGLLGNLKEYVLQCIDTPNISKSIKSS